MNLTKALKLYAVTDRSWLNGRPLAEDVEKVLAGGTGILQLREKHLSYDEFLQEGREIAELCRRYDVPLIINDNVEVAKALGVGAHIGQGDMSISDARRELGEEAIIGVSCCNVAQALEAERDGADYLGVGAVFPTSTKNDADYVDSRELAAICNSVRIPVVAIGGISTGNVMKLAGSGIAGVAVVSALFAAADPLAATRELSDLLDKMLAVPVNLPPGAIVDLDGTILSTISYWDRLPFDYLESKGVTPPPTIRDEIVYMEVEESAAYLKKRAGLSEDVSVIKKELWDMIRSVYTEKAQLMPGAREFLAEMRERGVRMAMFSATEHSSIVASLKRHGILDYFDCVISSADLPYDKSCPEAFLHVLGRLGTSLQNTVVYDDAVYALEGARKAGFKAITLEERA